MLGLISNYISHSSAITIIVLALLSVYFILLFWIFLYKFFDLKEMIAREENALEFIIARGFNPNVDSKLCKCINDAIRSKELLNACEISIVKDASKGVSWLSIISSTSPFIGLFGTVIGILESFAKFSGKSKVAFGEIAPAISEALVATAAGIFVAIFAYTFHQIIVRKIYELNILLKAESDIIVTKG